MADAAPAAAAQPAVVSATATAAPAPAAPVAASAPAKDALAADAKPESRDIGTWKFRPWNGVDHWVHERLGLSTFKESEARRQRRL